MKRTVSQLTTDRIQAILEIEKEKEPIDREFQGRPKKDQIIERMNIINGIISRVCRKYNLNELKLREVMGITKPKHL
jgi:hypothetical protein